MIVKLRHWALVLAVLSAFASGPTAAGSYKTLYQLNNHPDGAVPSGGVILGPSNALYGETAAGGTDPCTSKHGPAQNGCGTVYSLSQAGGFKVLVSFHGSNGAYGTSGLTLVGSTLIGATINGGANDDGVIYAVKTDGSKFTLIHQFSGTDGYQPIGPLIPGKNGVYYGITSGGGAGYPSQSPGVLFSLTSAGTLKVLYTFTVANGYNPTTLRATPSGTLVGSTFYGGPTNKDYCPSGCGVVFSFNPATLQYIVLQTFDGMNGISPYVGSVGPDGTVYGNNNNLFSISPAGTYQVLGTGGGTIGDLPDSGPALAPNGDLYGTYTQNLGQNDGTLYSYSNGAFSLDYTFGDDGAQPAAEPIVTPSGAVIGTENEGFSGPGGTIYEYIP
jgi:uncharacterized repeat protein (TIGR03803 family)